MHRAPQRPPGPPESELAGEVGEGHPFSLVQLPVLFMKEKKIISISICFLFQIKSILGQKYAFPFTTLASPQHLDMASSVGGCSCGRGCPSSTLRAGQGSDPGSASGSGRPTEAS